VTQKINNLQALRAYAALAVVIFHTGFIFPHIVISGYIMARICATDTRFFLRRRLIRIVPPYWAMTFLLFIFALRFPGLLQSTHPSAADLVKSLLFIPYYRADGLIRPLLYVGWSLNYEMLFYILIVLGIYLVPKHPLMFASGSLVTLHFICDHYASFGAVPMCYSNDVVFEFVLGILAYEISRRISYSTAVKMRLFSLLSLLVSLAGIVLLQGVAHSPLAMEWAAIQVLAMLVILSTSLLSQAGWDIRLRWVVIVGDASFGDRVLSPYLPWIQMRHASGAFPLSAVCVAIAILLHLKLEKPTVNYLNTRLGGHRRSAEFSRLQVSPEHVAP
jgi:exopolysaccharide production protein ExoZ